LELLKIFGENLMMYILIALAAIIVIVAVFIGLQFFTYISSYYSITTKRRFIETMMNGYYRSSYRLGQKIEKIATKKTGWLWFDLNVGQIDINSDINPTDSATSDESTTEPTTEPINAAIDSLAVTEFGVIALFYQDYKGKIASQPNNKDWAVFSGKKGGSSSKIVPSGAVTAQKTATLLTELLKAEDIEVKPVIPILVFANKCDITNVELKSGIYKIHFRNLTKQIQAIQLMKGTVYNQQQWKHIAKVMQPYANSVFVQAGVIKKSGKDVITLTQDFINRKNTKTTNAAFMRQAFRLAKDKEVFEALAWQRIIEIGQEMETDLSKERLAKLSTELLEIAQTNIALNFSADAAQTTTPDSWQDSLNSQSVSFTPLGTDKEMQTALDTSNFFDQKPGNQLEGNTVS
jgi:hypothetical protein